VWPAGCGRSGPARPPAAGAPRGTQDALPARTVVAGSGRLGRAVAAAPRRLAGRAPAPRRPARGRAATSGRPIRARRVPDGCGYAQPPGRPAVGWLACAAVSAPSRFVDAIDAEAGAGPARVAAQSRSANRCMCAEWWVGNVSRARRRRTVAGWLRRTAATAPGTLCAARPVPPHARLAGAARAVPIRCPLHARRKPTGPSHTPAPPAGGAAAGGTHLGPLAAPPLRRTTAPGSLTCLARPQRAPPPAPARGPR
jgi:hypothetical protein